ncbi:MAG: V-type ATP synthase subunit I [Treponema sp.]|nr:V-type ATP synthase subunit I [Treponema sp.]MCL2250647.1 V-type ATP synthase subunit I [Treponema sp.]
MKKICLVVQEAFRDIALQKLRDIGVIHLESRDIPVDINSNAQKHRVKVEDAIGLIRDFKLPKEKKPKKKKKGEPEDNRPPFERRQKPIGLHRGRRATDIFGTEEEEPYSLSAVRAPSRPDLSEFMLNIDKSRRTLKDRDIFLSHEIKRIQNWGNFDPGIIKAMFDSGMPVYLYEIFQDDFKNLEEDIVFIKVKTNKTVIHLIVFEKEIKGVSPVKIPEKSLNELLQEAEVVKKEISEYDEKLKNFANRRSALNTEMVKVQQDIEFEDAMANMEIMEEQKTENPFSKLSWLTGYVPAEDLKHVKAVARENCWALSAYDPDPEDEKVPTKLKNNKFVDILNPVTGFLGLLPGYREIDISIWFLVFFSIFFGMIFSDAAYGSMLALIAIFCLIKFAIDNRNNIPKKPIPKGFLLLLLLGVSNTIWGVLTCSWFGFEVEKVPQFLQDISLSYFSTAKTDPVLVTQNLQIFCFTLGLIHLSIAHLNNIVKFIKLKTPRFLADIGQIAMLTGVYNVVLMLIVSNETRKIDLHPVSLYLIAGGFLLNFLFGYYQTSFKQSVISSLQSIITVILGIVSVFSDIMSYIRLWAVGLAGAAIAGTVNLLAGPLFGNFLIFLGILLFIFGHGLNMVLNVLAVLVHGVRLNTLEFSGHVGLSWSGKAYKPFAKKEAK